MLSPTQRTARPHTSGPDIELVVNAETVIIDVTVVNPLNASARNAKPANAFARVERAKEAKYAAMCAEHGSEFVVAAVSAQGALQVLRAPPLQDRPGEFLRGKARRCGGSSAGAVVACF
jgi:hypothetical protein